MRLQPGAGKDEIVGMRAGVLAARVTAPASEGRANEALCRLLAKRLRLPRSSVTVVRGHRSRDKLLEIDGLDSTTLLERLGVSE